MTFVVLQHPSPKSVHCPKGDDVIREYLEDDALVARAYGKMPFGERRQEAKKSIPAVPPDLDELKVYYTFDSNIERYLTANQNLIGVLLKAHNQIAEYFKENYKHALVIPPQTRRIFVEIQTHHSFEEAISAMDSFDSNWWFNQSRDNRSKLEFSLDIR